ncbi:MAG: amidohydrolase family protein [Alphaproteobacteria bacterium]|nr:amidohydrolase family protein [Alphaproteobacteria bacterium]
MDSSTPHYDVVLTGDRIIDPATGRNGPAQIAITGGRIAAVADDLGPHTAGETLDARGRIVSPGLIDIHVHVYEWVTNFGLDPDDAGIHSGATTIVDQGSAGPWTVGGFKAYIADPAITDVRSFVSANVAGALMGGMEGTVLHNPGMMRIEAIEAALADYPGLVKGIKSHGESGGFSHWETEVLEMAVEAGERTGLPLYVHTGELFPVDEDNRPQPEKVMEAFFPLIRPGDTVAHVYSCMPDGIMGPGDAVPEIVRETLARGVHFDIGYGLNFSYRIARAMMAAGVLPNTIGSDVHGDFNGYHDDSKLDYSLCGAMTRLMALGMPLEDVILRTTLNPAKILGEEDDIGTLAVGSRADITVLDPVAGRWDLPDAEGEVLTVDERLVPWLVIRDGKPIAPDRRLLRDVWNTDVPAAAQ